MYLAARGSNYETQKQTIPEQKRIQKDVRTTERARSNSGSGTHTDIQAAARETTLPEELRRT